MACSYIPPLNRILLPASLVLFLAFSLNLLCSQFSQFVFSCNNFSVIQRLLPCLTFILLSPTSIKTYSFNAFTGHVDWLSDILTVLFWAVCSWVFLMETLFQATISKDKWKRIDFSSVFCMTNLQCQSYSYNVQYVNAIFPHCFPSLSLLRNVFQLNPRIKQNLNLYPSKTYF